MTEVVLVAGSHLDLDLPKGAETYVGLDRGCLALMKEGLPLTLAVGDFDSVSQAERVAIETTAQELLVAPVDKDETDLELGLAQVLARWPKAEVIIYGALGGRLDHALSNIFLPSHPLIGSSVRRICLLDAQNKVVFYPAGRQVIPPSPDYSYVAFMLEGEGPLQIKEAKYELNETNYFQRKIYSSNEFIGQAIEVFVPAGYLVVIYSKDR